jgi:hypothetical protein
METAAMRFLAEHGWRGSIAHSAEDRHLRDEFRFRFSFAILDSATVERLSHFAPLVEIGSGMGYWAWELRKAGVDIIATDPMGRGRYRKSGHWHEPWTAIEQLEAVAALRKYPARTLLSVWPDRGRTWPSWALRSDRGKRVLYVGEGPGGRTGNYEFHKILHEHFICSGVFPIPHFYGQHDFLWVWERRKAARSRLLLSSFGSMVSSRGKSHECRLQPPLQESA